jgi:2-polyprenyl-3-methyl-5-hydroxy-6-metoxy-1,4-benzoquinol methylase
MNWNEFELEEYGENSEYKKRLYGIFNYVNVENKRLLDVGSGIGKTGIWLAQKYKDLEVHLFDSNDNLIEMAKGINPCNNVTDFIVGNIASIEDHVTENIYDIVTCFDVIEHLNHVAYLKMIDGIWNALRFNGIAVILCGISTAPQHIHRLVPNQIEFDFIMSGKFKLKDFINVSDISGDSSNACLIFEAIKGVE